MHIKSKILDDLLREVYKRLLDHPEAKEEIASKGAYKELPPGVLLELENPKARISRTETKGKLFSALGELLWYLSGTNDLDFIQYYIKGYDDFSDDGKTVFGGYGPRLKNFQVNHLGLKINQLDNIIQLLNKRPGTRQAVIQLFDATDLVSHSGKGEVLLTQIEKRKDIPCTCTLQFKIKGNRLNMITHMRSNDAYKGLPHDIFCFTIIQEYMARELGYNIGTYKHFVGSLHLYKEDYMAAQKYLGEELQSSYEMKKMPKGSQEKFIKNILAIEKEFRENKKVDLNKYKLPSFWKDLALILKIWRLSKSSKKNEIPKVRKLLTDPQLALYTRRLEETNKPKSTNIKDKNSITQLEFLDLDKSK